MTKQDKKAFPDAGHTSIPVLYPDEVCLVGGADHITDKRQRGPLDSKKPEKRSHLYRPGRLTNDFKPGFVESIDLHGVLQAIRIVKQDNIPIVEYGQHRTRAARISNYDRRKACGQLNGKSDREVDDACIAAGMPLRRLRCDCKQDSSTANSIGRILAENHMRHDDDIETTLPLIKQLLDETENNFPAVARAVGETEQTIRFILQYDKHATPETKAAFKAGRLRLTHCATLAREQDPEAQNKALAELLAAPNPTVRRAAKIVRKDKGAGANPFSGKRELVKFSEFVKKEGGGSEFMKGALAMLALQTTGKATDDRLAKLHKKYEG